MRLPLGENANVHPEAEACERVSMRLWLGDNGNEHAEAERCKRVSLPGYW